MKFKRIEDQSGRTVDQVLVPEHYSEAVHMSGRSGYRVICEDANGAVLDRLIALDREEAIRIASAAFTGNVVRITITEEDFAIREARKAAGVDPNVVIEGPPGFRRVKSSNG